METALCATHRAFTPAIFARIATTPGRPRGPRCARVCFSRDAMNLGWKLAAVVQGRTPEALLDTYHFERHPVGSDLLKHTLAQTALIATFSPEGLALREMLAELVNHTPALSERLATTLSGLGVAYPSPDRS
ncbi:FAD-dependent monooxygenase [Streptomyces sp. NBC_01594]|uniref:FAD-dependent monooxygenase n=1 Tax=Streptomyces sp. NBC_01594 TaxID=2975890 RepID=UPI003865E63B